MKIKGAVYIVEDTWYSKGCQLGAHRWAYNNRDEAIRKFKERKKTHDKELADNKTLKKETSSDRVIYEYNIGDVPCMTHVMYHILFVQ